MRVVLPLLLALVFVVGTDTPAAAQRQRKEGRALFGGGKGRFNQSLSASSNLGASFVDPITPEGDTAEVPLSSPTWLGQADVNLTYGADLRFLRVGAAAGVFGNLYTQPQSTWIHHATYNATADGGHTWRLSQRTSLGVNLSATLQPSYWAATALNGQPSTLSDEFIPSLTLPADLTNFGGESLGIGGGATLSHQLSRRLSVSGDYTLTRRMEYGRPGAFNLFEQRVGSNLDFKVTAHLSARVGYHFDDARNGPPGSPHTRSHFADFGIDYGRGGTIRLSRHTTLTFNGGLSSTGDSRGTQRYFVVGSAELAHEIGRSWVSSLTFDRSLNFVSLFAEPVLADTATAAFGGLLAPRLSFQASTAYSRGVVGFVSAGHALTRANTQVTLQASLFQYLSLGATYAYYSRTIGDLVVTPSDLGRKSEGQVASVYVTTSAPLFHRTRRPDATR